MALDTNPSINTPTYPLSPSGPLLRFCCFSIPKIHVNVAFGTAPKRKPIAMDYTWGHLDETLYSGVHHPSSLIPGSGNQRAQSYQEPSGVYYQDQQNYRITKQRSASELTEGRSSIVSPVSPVSPISTEYSSYQPTYQPTPPRRPQQPRLLPIQSREPTWMQQQPRGMIWSLQTPIRGAPSPWSPQQPRANSWSPQRFSPLSPYENRNKPLPPLPSMGYSDRQDESPWSFESPPWASPVQQRSRRATRSQIENPVTAPPIWTDPEILVLPSETRLEDPQRIRDLSQLQEAMMTIDSLEGDFVANGTGEPHRGPRGVGWAITRNDFNTNTGLDRPPPPYVASQWDGLWEDYGHGLRRRSSVY